MGRHTPIATLRTGRGDIGGRRTQALVQDTNKQSRDVGTTVLPTRALARSFRVLRASARELVPQLTEPVESKRRQLTRHPSPRNARGNAFEPDKGGF